MGMSSTASLRSLVLPYHAALQEQEARVAVTAYVLIQTEVGKAAQVAEQVAAIDGVVSAEDVTGPYDVIVRAEANSVDELGKMVVSRVQLIDGITRTLTCPVVHL
jgi:DNA-binding Lrp family transcriptional regulator